MKTLLEVLKLIGLIIFLMLIYPLMSVGAEGTLTFSWHKVPRAAMEEYCQFPGAAACSIDVGGVCHLYAPDTEAGLPYLGREVLKCLWESPTAWRGTAGPLYRVNYRVVSAERVGLECQRLLSLSEGAGVPSIWRASRRASTGGSRACTDRGWMIIPATWPDELNEEAGHELKHVVDGRWHDGDGRAYMGAFQNERPSRAR